MSFIQVLSHNRDLTNSYSSCGEGFSSCSPQCLRLELLTSTSR